MVAALVSRDEISREPRGVLAVRSPFREDSRWPLRPLGEGLRIFGGDLFSLLHHHRRWRRLASEEVAVGATVETLRPRNPGPNLRLRATLRAMCGPPRHGVIIFGTSGT